MNLVAAVSTILNKQVTEEEAKDFALNQFGTLMSFMRKGYLKENKLSNLSLLDNWWMSLPFAALEKIHNIILFGLDDEQTEQALEEAKTEWDKMDIKEKENIFFDKYPFYVSETGEYDELFDELYNND
jgi:hypothetical protein